MNVQHVIKLNGHIHEVARVNFASLTLGAGKQRAMYYPPSGKLISKHVLTGQFRVERVTK